MYFPDENGNVENPMVIDSLWERGHCSVDEEPEERFYVNIEFDFSDVSIDADKQLTHFYNHTNTSYTLYFDDDENSGVACIEGWLTCDEFDTLDAILFDNKIKYKEIRE